MKLYLVQHGEAVSKDINPDRPLAEKGKEDIDKLAGFLKSNETNISNVFHSGKARALQTAEIFANTLGDIKVEILEGIAPNDPVDSLAAKITQLENNTMIVGHLPFMAKFISYLVMGDEEKIIVDYQPGSVICIEQDESNSWKIRWMIRPDCF